MTNLHVKLTPNVFNTDEHDSLIRKHTGLIQSLNPHARQEMEMLCNFNMIFFFNLNTRPQMLHVTVHTKLTV